jgi:hypothetical protein
LKVVQELRSRGHAADHQVIASARAGDIEQVPLGVVDLRPTGCLPASLSDVDGNAESRRGSSTEIAREE